MNLEKLYNEANIAIPDMVQKRVEDVVGFHKKLIENRNSRLTEEKEKLSEEEKILEKQRKDLGKQLDTNLKYLGEHGALDEFLGLTNKLNSFKAKLDKINSYKELLQEYKNRSEEIKITFSQENLETDKYLNTISKSIIEKNIEIYRSLSKEFYEDRPGGIEISNNEGINQLRYKINAKLEDDASDGINEVKIFCYDFTILLTAHNHHMKLLVHDSRLFSNMDPRQQATLFRLAYKHTHQSQYQYIVTINENTIEPLKSIYDDEEYKKIIKDNIILELTDESEKSKLLGIQVDMDYEKE